MITVSSFDHGFLFVGEAWRRVPRSRVRVLLWASGRRRGSGRGGVALTVCQALIRVFSQGQSACRCSQRLRCPRVSRAGRCRRREPEQFRRRAAWFVRGESQVPETGEQVRSQGDDVGQREVDRPVPRRPLTQPEGAGLLDVVFGMDVAAVAGVEPGELPDRRVGGDDLVAPAESSPGRWPACGSGDEGVDRGR